MPVRGLVETLRRVKDDAELQAIHTAAKLADEAFTAAIAQGIVARAVWRT